MPTYFNPRMTVSTAARRLAKELLARFGGETTVLTPKQSASMGLPSCWCVEWLLPDWGEWAQAQAARDTLAPLPQMPMCGPDWRAFAHGTHTLCFAREWEVAAADGTKTANKFEIHAAGSRGGRPNDVPSNTGDTEPPKKDRNISTKSTSQAKR